MYALFQLPKQSATSRLQLLCHPIQIPPYVQKLCYWPKFKFRETQQAEFKFLESQTSLVELIQVSRPQLTINEHLGVLPTGTSYRRCEAKNSPPSNTKVMNGWSYISILSCVFMAWYVLKYRDNFTSCTIWAYEFLKHLNSGVSFIHVD